MCNVECHFSIASRIQLLRDAGGGVGADDKLTRQPGFAFIENETDDVRFPVVIQILFVQIADRRIVDQRDTEFAL